MEINTRTNSLSIEQHSDGYLTYFPALEGYNTWGKTYEEARSHIGAGSTTFPAALTP
jgi:predicted RNase H-like HicB family nuclease